MDAPTKTFDAVAESRKWREATSRKLDAMTTEERIDYLRALGEQYAGKRMAQHPARESAAA